MHVCLAVVVTETRIISNFLLRFRAVVCIKPFTADYRRHMVLITVILNIALYLFFIIIVLVFKFSAKFPTDQCGSRVQKDLKDVYDTQRTVSIIYVSVISGISFLIGISFFIFGGKLWLQLSSKFRHHSSNSKVSGSFIIIIIIIITSTGCTQ